MSISASLRRDGFTDSFANGQVNLCGKCVAEVELCRCGDGRHIEATSRLRGSERFGGPVLIDEHHKNRDHWTVSDGDQEMQIGARDIRSLGHVLLIPLARNQTVPQTSDLKPFLSRQSFFAKELCQPFKCGSKVICYAHRYKGTPNRIHVSSNVVHTSHALTSNMDLYIDGDHTIISVLAPCDQRIALSVDRQLTLASVAQMFTSA